MFWKLKNQIRNTICCVCRCDIKKSSRRYRLSVGWDCGENAYRYRGVKKLVEFWGLFLFSYSLYMLSRTENNNKLFFSVLDYLGFSEDNESHFYFSPVLFPTLCHRAIYGSYLALIPELNCQLHKKVKNINWEVFLYLLQNVASLISVHRSPSTSYAWH